MINSNQTLRFNRTSRDAFGHQIHFDDSWVGKSHALETAIIAVCIFAAGFVLGVVL